MEYRDCHYRSEESRWPKERKQHAVSSRKSYLHQYLEMLGIVIFKIQLTEILNLEAETIIFITHILHLPRFPEEITPIPALTRGFSFFLLTHFMSLKYAGSPTQKLQKPNNILKCTALF